MGDILECLIYDICLPHPTEGGGGQWCIPVSNIFNSIYTHAHTSVSMVYTHLSIHCLHTPQYPWFTHTSVSMVYAHLSIQGLHTPQYPRFTHTSVSMVYIHLRIHGLHTPQYPWFTNTSVSMVYAHLSIQGLHTPQYPWFTHTSEHMMLSIGKMCQHDTQHRALPDPYTTLYPSYCLFYTAF